MGKKRGLMRELQVQEDDQHDTGRESCAGSAGGEEEEDEAVWMRDMNRLWIHRDTMACISKGCRPCAYKLIIFGKNLKPNQRPECCLRAKAERHQTTPLLGLYHRSLKILTVGDGNFSFSLALAQCLRFEKQNSICLTATSHESTDSLFKTYPGVQENLKHLASHNVPIHHCIDATDPNHLKNLGMFDRVLWNFPCVRMPDGADGQNDEMEENKQLLRNFFRNCPVCLSDKGEIHITHKTKAPFGQWGIVDIAQSEGLEYLGSIVFDRCLYPGYVNKKVLSKRSFPIWDSQTYVFSKPRLDNAFVNTCPWRFEALTQPSADGILDRVTSTLIRNVRKTLEVVQPTSSPSLRQVLNKRQKKTRLTQTSIK